MWTLATTKGWDTAVEASVSTGARMGTREDILTDRMIRVAVRALIAPAVVP